MMQELMRMVERTEQEPHEHQLRRIGARQLRARQREERRAEEAIMEIAWSRLC
ncbi:MAG TPA: hypothetical protein K8V84_14765 [Nocardiopsis listeri]|uniref:hypothetical protein n=1 Tax=Nocardiopsis listeri TaxID=53440 RepID=UPI001D56A7E7|nr:hypothetical protein [Nocardiopsis listeri]HJE59748.1 hypothetical protein [Nocardiopsis listeri]